MKSAISYGESFGNQKYDKATGTPCSPVITRNSYPRVPADLVALNDLKEDLFKFMFFLGATTVWPGVAAALLAIVLRTSGNASEYRF